MFTDKIDVNSEVTGLTTAQVIYVKLNSINSKILETNQGLPYLHDF